MVKKNSKKKTKKNTKKAVPALVLQSKIKEIVREGNDGIRVSGDLFPALNAHMVEVVERARSRALANNRKTIRPEDI